MVLLLHRRFRFVLPMCCFTLSPDHIDLPENKRTTFDSFLPAGHQLRAKIAADTVNAKRGKKYKEKGMLVPDEIVIVENGCLLDGYPRSLSQAKALEDQGIRPDLFNLLD